MVYARVAGCALLLSAVAACSQHGPAGAAPATATAAAAAADDEGPRIAMSPDNVHIEYRVYGRGDPAVVLVHGWASDANYWSAQLEALKAHYTVVALNLAGHGASGNNRSDWSIANYAQDVAAVARQIPNSRLVLVGHSMGAAVSLAATPLIGTRVIGVIAVEALAGRSPDPLASTSVARTTYCTPQIGSLGLSEAEAKEAGYDVATGVFPFRGNARALIWGEPGGFCKVVADRAGGAVLGVHVIGHDVTELVWGPALGALLETTPFEMGRTVAPHPTLSEVLSEAALAVSGEAIHI